MDSVIRYVLAYADKRKEIGRELTEDEMEELLDQRAEFRSMCGGDNESDIQTSR